MYVLEQERSNTRGVRGPGIRALSLGEAVVHEGSAPKQVLKLRICATCGTLLTSYNLAPENEPRCLLHQEPKFKKKKDPNEHKNRKKDSRLFLEFARNAVELAVAAKV